MVSQKNRLNATVLLSIKKKLELMGKKIITILRIKSSPIWTLENDMFSETNVHAKTLSYLSSDYWDLSVCYLHLKQ